MDTRKLPDEEQLERLALKAQELVDEALFEEAAETILALPEGSQFSGWLHEKVLARLQLTRAQLDTFSKNEFLSCVDLIEQEIVALENGGTWEPADAYLSIADICEVKSESKLAQRFIWRAVDVAKRTEALDVDSRKILMAIVCNLSASRKFDDARAVASAISLPSLRKAAIEEVEKRKTERA